MTLRASILLEIIHGIDRIDVNNVESLRQSAIQLVRNIGQQHGVKLVSIDERTNFARLLLNAKVSRPTIRDRLCARYGISEKQAYRTIAAASNLGHKSPPNDTQAEQN